MSTETQKVDVLAGYPERCFACDKRLSRPQIVFLEDRLSDLRQYEVHVGPECFARVEAAGAAGYQPPKGGPRLYMFADDARIAHLARLGGAA